MSRMSELDMVRRGEPGLGVRCASCGNTEARTGIPITTIVIDWRTEAMCDPCVSRYDWSQWNFDPILNIYSRK